MNKIIKLHQYHDERDTTMIYLNVDNIVMLEDSYIPGGSWISLHDFAVVTVLESPIKVMALINEANGGESLTSKIDSDNKLYYLRSKGTNGRLNYLNYGLYKGAPSYALGSNISTLSIRTQFSRSEYPKIAQDIGAENLLYWFKEKEIENE